MAYLVSNFEQLFERFNILAQVALDNTMQRLLEKLQEYIKEDVYEAYEPEFYERTYELLRNWEFTNSITIGNTVVSELHGIDNMFSHDDEKWHHGHSKYNSLIDNMEDLAEIVDYGKIGDIANFPQLDERPFWDDFVLWADENINNIFQEECAKVGLNLISTSISDS